MGNVRSPFRLALLVTLLVNGLAALAIVPQVLRRFGRPLNTDFGDFYAAAKLAVTGHPTAAYDPARLERLEKILNHGHPLRIPFPYPPHVLLLLEPLAQLPASAAFVIWTAINVAAFAATAVLVLRRMPAQWQVAGAALFLTCLPMLVSTAQGENAGFVCLGFALVCLSLVPPEREGGRQAWTELLQLSVGIELLSTKPQFLVVPLVVIAARRHRTEIAAAAGALGATALFGLIPAGIEGYSRFLHLLAGGLVSGAKYHWWPAFNYSLQAQVQALFGHSLLADALWIVPSLGALVWLFIRARRPYPMPWLLLAALAIVTTTHAMFHDLVLLLPAVVMALPVKRLRWPSLALLLAWVVDPLAYASSHIHVVTLAAAGAAIIASRPIGQAVPRIERLRSGVPARLWKSFAPPRWGSVSGSETR